MLPIEKKLGEMILDMIKLDPKSISGITRELQENGYTYHKLVVTGYLKALDDFGYVRERDLPPSKIYYKTTPHRKDIYESIGEHVSNLDLSKRNQVLVAIYILGRLFHRPIFKQELVRCGFTDELDAPGADPEKVSEARKLLAKTGIRIPRNEPAYESNLNYDYEFQRIMLDILIEQFGIKRMMTDRMQSKLETD
jgi:predicted transcriptional regulator